MYESKQEVLRITNSPTLFEVLAPNLMELNLSELTLISLNPV
jgi:hypothetical protein